MNRVSLGILLGITALFSMGLLMVYGTTSAEMLGRDAASATSPLIKQTVYACITAALMYAVFKRGHHSIIRLSPFAFWGCVALLVACFVPGIGQQINGSNRWVGVGPLSFQPSEFMKPIGVLFTIHYILQNPNVSFKAFVKLFFLLSIPLALILLEPDNGTVAILLATLVTLFFLSKIRWYYWGLPLLLLAVSGALAASQMSHVQSRIRVYLNPELDILGKGHQPYQAKIAAGSGGVFGRGVGESLQKLNYLPEARCDYIAAIYAEEFGFFGSLVLILLYMSFTVAGFWVAGLAPDRGGKYLAATLTFMVAFQAFLNLGVVSGLLPSKGTNLPFFSQGGSSLMMNGIAVALILSVCKKERVCTSY